MSRCKGKKKNGGRCRRRQNSDYCFQHQEPSQKHKGSIKYYVTTEDEILGKLLGDSRLINYIVEVPSEIIETYPAGIDVKVRHEKLEKFKAFLRKYYPDASVEKMK